MASPVYIAYAIVNILLDRKLHSIRSISYDLQISKNTVFNHVAEMQSQSLVEIVGGKYGGVRWIRH